MAIRLFAPLERAILARLVRDVLPSLLDRPTIDAFEHGHITASAFICVCEQRFPEETARFCENMDRCGILDGDSRARVLLARFKHGFKLKEYIAFDFAHKDVEEWGTYIADSGRAALECGLNKAMARDVLIEKDKTYAIFQKAYKREQVITKGLSFADFQAFASRHSSFVVKNRTGSRGIGFMKVDDVAALDLKAFYKEAIRGTDMVLEEVIRQSADLARFNASSVNTVRIVCFNGKEGLLTPYCVLRMGIGGSVVDNASAGGIFVAVDPYIGVVTNDAHSHAGGEYATHPDTGMVFKGQQLPDWEGLRALVTWATNHIYGMGYVGWDLAHTDQGWVIVEGNCGAGLVMIQVSLGRGIKTQVSRIVTGMDVPLGKEVLYTLASFG